MSRGSTQRNLSHQLNADLCASERSKMVPSMFHEAAAEEEDMDAGTDSSTQSATLLGTPAVSTLSGPVPSPSSTESLIERTLDKLLLTPMGDIDKSPVIHSGLTLPPTVNPTDLTTLMAAFFRMLSRGLAQTATQITSIIQADLHNLCARIEAIEQKAEHTIPSANQNTSHIQDLQDQLESVHEKIDDLENRTRCYNFRVRGLPESIKDSSEAVCVLIKEPYPLELDRVPRSLQPPVLMDPPPGTSL